MSQVSGAEARRMLEESVYYGRLRCGLCDWTHDLDDDATVADAREIFDEHYEESHTRSGGADE